MLKKYRNHIIFFYTFSAILLVVAVFADLKIDIALNNPTNPYAVWFYNTGEVPSRLICPLAGLLIFYIGSKKLEKTAGALICLGGSAYFGYYFGKHFFVEENRMLFSIVFGLGFGLAVLYAGKFIVIPENKKKILYALAVAGIIVMAVQLISVGVLKSLWGRVRFRDLLKSGSNEAFTPWYKINGINGNKSFPSGHTAGAAMSFLMMLFPFISEKYEKHSSLMFVIPFIYTMNVAVTRLIMGAHYLSDVAAGGIIGFTTVVIAIAVLDRKKQKITGNTR